MNKIKSLTVVIYHARHTNDPGAIYSDMMYYVFRRALEMRYSAEILAVYTGAVVLIYHDMDQYPPLEISNIEMVNTDGREMKNDTKEEIENARKEAEAVISRIIEETFAEVAEQTNNTKSRSPQNQNSGLQLRENLWVYC